MDTSTRSLWDSDDHILQDVVKHSPVFLTIVYLAIVLVGIVSSVIIIYMFLYKAKLRSPSNLFIVNVAIADCSFLIALLLPAYSMLFNGGRTVYGELGCIVHGVSIVISAGSCLLSLNLVALSRYVAIVHPQRRHILTWGLCAALCVYPWIHITLLTVPVLTGWGRIGWNPASWTCTFDWTYNANHNYLVFVFTQGVSALFLLFSYSQIYLVYRVAEANNGQAGVKKEEIRLAAQLVVIFAIYNLCWFPYFIITVFLYPDGDADAWLYAVAMSLLASSSAVNIFVYLGFNVAFRMECWKTFRQLKPMSALSVT